MTVIWAVARLVGPGPNLSWPGRQVEDIPLPRWFAKRFPSSSLEQCLQFQPRTPTWLIFAGHWRTAWDGPSSTRRTSTGRMISRFTETPAAQIGRAHV